MIANDIRGACYNLLMDKKLNAYIDYIEKEGALKDKKAADELIEFHLQMTQHFQHERLIHLIVTMFFALFLLLCFVFFLVLSLTLAKGGMLLIAGMGIITLILLVTTLFYAAHYYKLENGTQRLEDVTRKLYGRDWYKNKK